MIRTDDTGPAPSDRDDGAVAQAPRPSRRAFFALGAAAAGFAMTTRAEGQILRPGPGGKNPTGATGLKPEAASIKWPDPVVRLVRRISYGVTPAEIATAKAKGYAGYLDYQLNPAAIDDSEVEAFVAANMPTLAMPYAQLVTAPVTTDQVNLELGDAALYRAAFSKRQLLERMVDFWSNHFNVSLNRVGVRKAIDDREVIRQHALGKFPDLLRASSKSPAMLVYLDQYLSKFPTPNQNYAREVMELHTLGVNGGYTQTDVDSLARILTGWSVNGADFVFNRTNHDRGQNGPKVFLGRTFPTMPATASAAEMQKEGEDAIDMLAAHPSTANFISLKLARWLLAYEPPQDIVDRTAAVYLSTGGDIPSMIRTILPATTLMAAAAKYRRPFHYAAASLRALGAQVANVHAIRVSADAMGMPIFQWEQPNGYPDNIEWWSGLVLLRWQFANTLSVANTATTTRVDLTPFKAQGNTVDGVVKVIDAQLFGGEIVQSLQQQLTDYLKAGTFNDTRIREGLALALSSQQFQWY